MPGRYRVLGPAVGHPLRDRQTDRGSRFCPRATLVAPRGREADLRLGDSDSAADLGAEPPVGPGHGDISVPISPTHDHAEPIQLTQQRESRLAIVVVGAHRDHREPSMYRREEGMIRIGAAVMRHLQHVRRNISPDPEQLLSFDLSIPGQEDPNSVTVRAQHQRRIIGIGPSAAKRAGRTEHLECDASHPQAEPNRGRLGLQVARPQCVSHQGGAGFRLAKWAGDHPADPAPMQHTTDASDMIHMVMRQHE